MPSTSAAALEVLNLHKRFNEPAVDDLSLTVRSGEFFALLGPNGAGKTTTLRMVAGLLQADAGAVKICGIDAFADPIAAKKVLAWVPDDPMVYDKLTPLEYLEFVAGLWDMPPDFARFKADSLLDSLGLGAHANERCGGFSKGMRQKVALAGALIHEPRLIILDEPLTGLDASSARQVKRVLSELVAHGVSIIMTTHILEVAERMADRIGIIARGRLVAEGTLEELRERANADGNTLEDIFLEIVGGEAGSEPPAQEATGFHEKVA
ncbi:ABC transporter ATP-binding protein [Roseibium alexandrii]|uniref:ABC transporter ATP-binding protein n=1 Tax=Roseibium alexandrii TaxID=388408 RepID=UPI00375353B7